MFTAYYAPKKGYEKSGFATEDEAWEYVYTQMCPSCRQSLAEWKDAGEKDEFPILGCEAEWFVLPTEKFEKAEGFADILEGAGYYKVDPGSPPTNR